MQKIHFYKMHGTGNDFILIDNRAHSLTAIDAEVLKEMCAFHTGIGADGIMFLSKCNEADFKLAYYNSNGFPAEMCGNGARCAIYLAHLLN
nr:diaminopimelate epimerase [Calditrichia bacterium]